MTRAGVEAYRHFRERSEVLEREMAAIQKLEKRVEVTLRGAT